MQDVRSFILVVGLLALACSSVFGAETAPESACKLRPGQPSVDGGPYTASCASKTDCAATDTLVIVGAKPEQGPAGICLRIGEAVLELRQRAQPKADAASAPPPAPSPAASFVLANVLHDALYGNETDAIARALKQGTDLRQDIKVMMTDEAGQQSQKTVRLDTTALWTSGLLKLRAVDAHCEPGPACKVGERFSIAVPGLAAWAAATKADPSKLVLVINDVRMVGLTPVWHQADDQLSFKLLRLGDKADNLAAWASVLPDLMSEGSDFKVGLADEKAVVTSAAIETRFEPWTRNRYVAALFTLLVMGLFTGLLLKRSGWSWIRDDDYGVPAAAFANAGLPSAPARPFSLGRSQMLFWTFAVAAATVTIGATTGAWMSINNTALILLGLGVGTALGSVAAGVPQVVSDALNAYKASAAGTPAQATAAKALCALLTSSGNWFKDVSSDYGDSRAGVHRLQSMIATLGFGLFFVYRAFNDGVMPTFTDTQLALLGISGSAYVGFKMAG